MSWEAASVIVNSLLALATVVIIVLNYRQVEASKQQADASEDQVRIMQKQVDASLEQVRVNREQLRQSQQQMQEQVRISEEQLKQSQQQVQGTLEAAQRPFVFPVNLPALESDGSAHYFNFEQLDPTPQDPHRDEIGLKNGGTGIALNILGILMQPRPLDEVLLNMAPRCRTLEQNIPLPPGVEVKKSHMGANSPVGWDFALGDDPSNTMAAPSDSILRLTIFQEDIFNQYYASQFDLRDNAWHFHWFGKIIPGLELFERLKQ